jgi:5-formyltetrahydrofolate cyclo-ligase
MNGISTTPDKNEVRQLVRQRKNALTGYERDLFSARIVETVEQFPPFCRAESVLCYWPLPGEVQIGALIRRYFCAKHIYLPVVKGNHLELRRYEGESRMRQGAFGIMEPLGDVCGESIDLVIVPGIAFDRSGIRLGRGKGFYDRLFVSLEAPKVGVAFQCQLFNKIPADAWDKPVDAIITETETLWFGNQALS